MQVGLGAWGVGPYHALPTVSGRRHAQVPVWGGWELAFRSLGGMAVHAACCGSCLLLSGRGMA